MCCTGHVIGMKGNGIRRLYVVGGFDQSIILHLELLTYLMVARGHIFECHKSIVEGQKSRKPEHCVCSVESWATYPDNHMSRLSHLSTFSSHLTVVIAENLLLSFFSFTFKPKTLQSFISSQLTTYFCHDSQKTSMPPELTPWVGQISELYLRHVFAPVTF